jgi:hypothetical protein
MRLWATTDEVRVLEVHDQPPPSWNHAPPCRLTGPMLARYGPTPSERSCLAKCGVSGATVAVTKARGKSN